MKVADIKPDVLRAGQREAMQRDIEWLAQRRARFEDVTCPACDSGRRESLYVKYGMPQVRCVDCGTQYACPRPTADLLAEFYRRSANYAYWAKYMFPASAEARRANIFQPRAELAADFARRRNIADGTIIEVGAAYGLFCEELAKLGTYRRIIGIEPTPDLAAECRARGFEVIEAPYEQVKLDEPADVIAAFEVIEHLHRPEAFLHWVLATLRPGGYVLLTCPNCHGFDTLLLGENADAIDHEHLNLFHPGSIRLLAERVGFTEIAVETPGRLDVDIVRRAFERSQIGRETLGPFLTAVLEAEDPAVGEKLQCFLQSAGFSSNMMLTARRPAQ
jgi:SAM-dependent methyltransferase